LVDEMGLDMLASYLLLIRFKRAIHVQCFYERCKQTMSD
jgi:hypothetical protein